jgi:hypothetical protein
MLEGNTLFKEKRDTPPLPLEHYLTVEKLMLVPFLKGTYSKT